MSSLVLTGTLGLGTMNLFQRKGKSDHNGGVPSSTQTSVGLPSNKSRSSSSPWWESEEGPGKVTGPGDPTVSVPSPAPDVPTPRREVEGECGTAGRRGGVLETSYDRETVLRRRGEGRTFLRERVHFRGVLGIHDGVTRCARGARDTNTRGTPVFDATRTHTGSCRGPEVL